MPLPLTEEHHDLAAAVASFTHRDAPMAGTRAQLVEHAAGQRPGHWDALLRQGLHCLHLPEEHGGADAGIAELAVVVEQLGRALTPGPFLPTVATSAVLATADTSQNPASETVARELLSAFGDGATGALVADEGLTAVPTESGWTVDGTSVPVLGLAGADIVVARADGQNPGDEPIWFRVSDPSSVTAIEEGVDLTRSVGRLTLRGHHVDERALLPGPALDQVKLIVNALLAAEASGLMSWCLDTAIEHVRSRVQFDKPVGSFQAVQHKAATMLISAERACAAAWDAARAADQATEQPDEQLRLASAQAALTAVAPSVDVALECVTLLGAVGFTWEHDAHLYWRRAISIAATAGPEEVWAQQLGEAALTAERDFSIADGNELPELRAEVGHVLDEVGTLPADPESTMKWGSARGGPRKARLAEAGLVAPHYPQPYGRGAGPTEQAVIAQEFTARGLPQPSTVIGEWVLPTILLHGTAAQQERFLDPSLRGEIVWCQLFSEPGAGSDLAGLSTKARRETGGWVLTGQKVWNSSAHEADWGICLARTDPDAPKHHGLSYFLVDMTSPGIEVRPIRQATGLSEFNEVFFNDVFVPDECLVGEPGKGWRLAVTTLGNERLSMGSGLSHGSTDLVRQVIASGGYAGTRQDALRVLGHDTAREMSLGALGLRGALNQLAGQQPGAEISVRKVFNAIAQRDGSRDALRLLGPFGAVAGSSADPDCAIDHIGVPAVLFGGGTIEIQLNVIAQRVLGLPR